MPKSKTYEEFVEKFKPKLTTDDCATPELVYDAVLGWVAKEYGIDPKSVLRPFWPGLDYQQQEYPDGCVVVDNPPFSILSKICEWYLDRNIKFFLFAPSLTALSGKFVERWWTWACQRRSFGGWCGCSRQGAKMSGITASRGDRRERRCLGLIATNASAAKSAAGTAVRCSSIMSST